MSPRFEPPPSELSAPFWDASRRRELVLQWCSACDVPIHYPREACPYCLSDVLEWRPATGRGEVHAFVVPHKGGFSTMGGGEPYVVALIDLDEGARVMSNVVGCEPGRVQVGMPVKVTWEELPDGRNLPLFAPA